MGPPEDISPEELVNKLLQMPAPSEIVDFPRKDKLGQSMKVRILVLEQSQHDEARFAAEDYLAKKNVNMEMRDKPAVKEIYGDAVAREILARAVVRVEPISEHSPTPTYPRLFINGDSLARLTADEVSDLFAKYMLVQYKYGPDKFSIQSEDDITAWIKKLKEGLDGLPLGSLDWHQLAGLNLSLVKRSFTLSTILESLYSNLPSTLKSQLETLGIGNGSFGSLQETESDEDDAESLLLNDIEIDDETVADLLLRLRDLSEISTKVDVD